MVFAVLGAGMQGTAAAYDLAKFGNPKVIRLGDVSLEQATKSANRVNHLVGRKLCRPIAVNALEPASLAEFLTDTNVLLSCVPYWMHPRIAKVAIECGVNMCDLGGNTDVTMETLELNSFAESAGVSLVPDCGLAPGLVNSIGLWLIEHLEEAHSVKLYCGVLPQHPVPPFNYKLTFNVEGLVTEYDYQAVVLRNGEIQLVETLAEVEELHLEELGPMEAFTTSGGTSTAPYTLKNRVHNYEYKTIRFPGHCERMRIFKDFGFWSEQEVNVKGVYVKPKDVFNRVFGESLGAIQDRDQCFVRGVGVGLRGGEGVRLQVDISDRQCEDTNFTSMERLTGFSLSIYAIYLASGAAPKGCLRYEDAMTGTHFVEEISKRGISLRFSEERVANHVLAV